MSYKELKTALLQVWNAGEIDSWPYQYGEFSKAFYLLFYQYYSEAIGYSCKTACLFTGPSSLIRSFDFLLPAMFLNKKSENQILVDNVIKILIRMKQKDYCNLEYKNMLLVGMDSGQNLQQVVRPSDIPAILHRIIALLRSYCEFIYYRAYDISIEIHGPYQFNDHNLLVYEYRNLHPQQLYDAKYILSCSTIKIECLYHEDAQIQLDLYNHLNVHIQKQTNQSRILSDQLLGWSIYVDGNPYTLAEITTLETLIIEKITYLNQYLRSQQKYAEILWYRLYLQSGKQLPPEPPPAWIKYAREENDVVQKRPLIDNRIIDLIF